MILIGSSGGSRDGMAAVAERGRIVAACSQERVTRLRGAGVSPSGLPEEAIDVLLERLNRTRQDVSRYQRVEPPGGERPSELGQALDYGLAVACTAYLTSGLSTASAVVCDRDVPGIQVWQCRGSQLVADQAWPEATFFPAFSRVVAALGFHNAGASQRFEALARLQPGHRDAEIDAMFEMDDGCLRISPSLERATADRLAGDRDPGSLTRSRLASAAQARLGELLIDLLTEIRRRSGAASVCLGGSLFYRSFVNTLVKQSALFDQVFVPVDPGPTGLAVGAVLHTLEERPAPVTPFLGPAYSTEETKEVLDNCKLHYSWQTEEGSVQAAVDALRDGRLVGWFDGPMEWGPRAVGARCILANPAVPYVLENLNRFLKRREAWRGYALSGPLDAVSASFDGPAAAPFMECDYLPKDPGQFRHILPSPTAAIRVHTVTRDASLPLFYRLLEAVGETTGQPFVVNTSFNGFHEPIVCSPRDAVRVFFGTGIDVLVMNQFVLRK